jgi:hypothetical protein
MGAAAACAARGGRDDSRRVRSGKRPGGPGQSKPVWLWAGNKTKTGLH